LRNAARFTFVEYLAFVFAILGKVLVITLVCLLSYIILDGWDGINKNLSSYFGPILIIAIMSYAVCQVFFAVFAIAGNTILHCFLLDLEISNASGRGSAGHQPPALRKFIKQIRRDQGEDVSDSEEDANRK
jgi:hypothetical protein